MQGSLNRRPKSPVISLVIPLLRARMSRALHMPISTAGNVKSARTEIRQVSVRPRLASALYVEFLARRCRLPLIRYYRITCRAPFRPPLYLRPQASLLNYLCPLATRNQLPVPLVPF